MIISTDRKERRRPALVTKALPGLLLLAVAGCSFQGSVSAAGTSGAHRSSAGQHSSSSAPGTTGSSTASSSGSSSAPGGTSATTSSSGRTAGEGGRVDRCHTSELTGSLVPGSPGAGQRYATLVLTNTGGETCTVHGYGGVGLVNAAGAPLPTQQIRVTTPAPTTVTLEPHDAVRSRLHWSVVPGEGDALSGQCQPTPAALQVIPPDETDHLSVPWHYGPVCEGGTIQQQAYAPA